MDQNEQQLQSLGICHRLFCFIMRTLAAQALKPVTLGPPAPRQPALRMRRSSFNQLETGFQDVDSNNRGEDSESLSSIDIEGETSRLLVAERADSWWYGQGRVIVESVGDSICKAPRKVVSIKDEPEIINEPKRRKKNGAIERRNEGDQRPLKSILKVGSNLSKTSTKVVNSKTTND